MKSLILTGLKLFVSQESTVSFIISEQLLSSYLTVDICSMTAI